jgi:hypothetical protein
MKRIALITATAMGLCLSTARLPLIAGRGRTGLRSPALVAPT